MLELRSNEHELIKEWEIESTFKKVIFSIHTTDVISVYEDKQAITLFYGFLDQDYEGSAAQFVHSLLINKGPKGLSDCYGSFVVFQYDLKTQKIILSNDALGDFAAHYYINQDILYISDLPDLILNKNNKEVSERRLVEYFAISKPQDNVGFFKHIKQVNPGQFLVLHKGKIIKGKYYSPNETVNFKNTSIEDLSQSFIELMQSAIKYQTKGYDQVGVMLSGGMDSTFVTANAVQVCKKISTFSYVFPNIPEADESIWLDSMRSLDIEMNTFVGESHWPLKDPYQVSINSPLNNPYRNLKEVIYKSAQSKQIKMLLSGVYADHLYTGYIYWLIDQIKKQPLTAVKSLFSTMKQCGFVTGLRQVSPRKWSNQIKPKTQWLSYQAQQQFNEIQSSSSVVFKHPHPQQFALVYALSTAQSVWLDHEHGYRNGLFVRHPFRDRRVVEFMMSIPAWILGNNQLSKTFVRTTAKDLLPEAITRRKTLSTLTPFFVKGLLDKEHSKVKKLLSGSHATWQNYLKEELISKIIKDPKSVNQEKNYLHLWQCVSYEMWQEKLRGIK